MPLTNQVTNATQHVRTYFLITIWYQYHGLARISSADGVEGVAVA